MNLSQLIEQRESLTKYLVRSLSDELIMHLSVIKDSAAGYGQTVPIENIKLRLANIKNEIDGFYTELQASIDFLDQSILARSTEYFVKSYDNYSSVKDEPIREILDRELRITDEDSEYLKSKLRVYSNWRYPGAIIRPGKQNYYREMVDCDPFYVIDHAHDLIAPCIKETNELYQSRVRRIICNDQNVDTFPGLPKNQLGLIFAWNFFNYKPLEVLKKYFEQIYSHLKPGGAFLMTYNNCSRSLPVKLVEHNWASYTPDWSIKEAASVIGFKTVSQYDGQYHFNLLEFKKPGSISSLRGGQSLAKIIEKSK
jgi:hypothetical protein